MPDQKPRGRSLRADPLPRHPLLDVGIPTPRVYIGLIHGVPGLPGAGGRRVGVVRQRIEPETNRRPVLEPLVTTEPPVAAPNVMLAVMSTAPRCPRPHTYASPRPTPPFPNHP